MVLKMRRFSGTTAMPRSTRYEVLLSCTGSPRTSHKQHGGLPPNSDAHAFHVH
jgi:hypothetical protein